MNNNPDLQTSKQQPNTNVNLVQKILLNSVKPEPQGISPMQQLELMYDKQDSRDINQLRLILSKVLAYPSSDIAQLHMEANKIGDFDLKQTQFQSDKQNFKQISQHAKFCPCCGFILQQSSLPICVSIKNINHMGISTFLYFNTLKNVTILLLAMLFVFSIYSLASNYVSSDQYKSTVNQAELASQLNSFDGFLAISLGSKQLNSTDTDKTSFLIQCWLGVATIAIWGLMFGFINKQQRKICIQVDIDSKTASDFSIIVQNYPSATTKQQFQLMLQQYQAALGQVNLLQAKTPIKIRKINMAKPFYLNQQNFSDQKLEELNKKYEQYRKKFIQWILQRVQSPRFGAEAAQRLQAFKQFQKIKKQRMDIYKQLTDKVKKQKSEKLYQQTVPTFITFESSYNKQFLQYMHEDSHRVFSCLPFYDKSKYLYFKSKEGETGTLAKIKQAPEPEDVIWTNLGQPDDVYIKKRLITFSVSILVLGASFGSIYGLSKVQFDYSKTHNDASNQYISILISLCISIINIIIQQILRLLTKLERNPTNTEYQASLGIKAVIALLINSILIPILVNHFFKENLYGVNGLAYDVFYLAITNSFLTPLLKIFDIYYYFTRFWRWYKDQPQRKLYMNQNQLNTISEYMEFEIGYEYIYIVNLFLFTCFFSPLQPIIVVFAVSGLFMMYWAQKYSLLNRCKRPTPGNNAINTTMYQLIYLGPAFYTIGSFCWSNFFKENFIGIAPNLTAAIISAVIFLIPYKRITKQFFEVQPEPQLTYQNDRIFMPSEYDRLNPSTSAEGVQDYMNYLADYKKRISLEQKNSPEQVRYVQDTFIKQFGLGGRPKYQAIAPSFNNFFSFNNGNYYDENQLILQQLIGTNENIFNPAVIGNAVLNQNQGLKMPTQNWFTNQQSEVVQYLFNGKQPQPEIRKDAIKNLLMPIQQGELVTYEPQPQISKNGDITFLYKAVENLTDLNSSKKRNTLPSLNNSIKNQKGQVPLNIPLNMFGSLLKPVNTQNSNQQMNEQQNGKYNLFNQLFKINQQNKKKNVPNISGNYQINLSSFMKQNLKSSQDSRLSFK